MMPLSNSVILDLSIYLSLHQPAFCLFPLAHQSCLMLWIDDTDILVSHQSLRLKKEQKRTLIKLTSTFFGEPIEIEDEAEQEPTERLHKTLKYMTKSVMVLEFLEPMACAADCYKGAS